MGNYTLANRIRIIGITVAICAATYIVVGIACIA